jgi:hypothetical protein
LATQGELHFGLDQTGVFEACRNEIVTAEARAGEVHVVESRLFKYRADQICPLQTGAGKIGTLEQSAVHLDPAQVQPGENAPG